MRILFVNVVDLGKPTQTLYHPLSFGYLISYAEKQGVHFDHAYTEKLNKKILEAFNPDVVAMTAITENYERAKRYAHLVKQISPRIKVVIGGVHISSVPESLSQDMDVGVVGEGEDTFLELISCRFDPNESVAGIVYRNPNGRLVVTRQRDLIEPLDDIPYPNRDIFTGAPRPTYIFTSRGCAYRCAFCCSSRFWGKVRFHSVDYVAGEIWALSHRGVKTIHVYDDCFVLDMERVRRIRDKVKGCGIRFSIAARANLVTDEAAEVLADMGVYSVGMGLESNSKRILDYLNKGNTPADNQRAVDVLRRHGLAVHCSFIRGIPIETKADLKATYDFIKRNRLSFRMYRLMRFPNTPLYEGSENWEKCKVHTYRNEPVPQHIVNWGKRKVLSIIRG